MSPRHLRTAFVHGGLFLLTFLTATLAGVQWLNKDPLELTNIPLGIPYAALLLLMLSCHEFGHYIAALLHGVDATLPYYIPFPSQFGLFTPFGTLGAVIRVKSVIPSRKATFDIGASGPIAGFVVSVVILIIGFKTLPPIDYLYAIHPEYTHLSSIPPAGLTFGRTLFYDLLASAFAPAGAFLPPMNEIYHYPFLCVGWFGMFVTAFNLIPIGQLDGGHIAFAMFGNSYHRIGQVMLILLIIFGTIGFLPLFGIPVSYGWPGWLFLALVLAVLFRRGMFNRPPLQDASPLNTPRMLLGWFCFLIFVGAFSIAPITLEMP